MNRIVFTLLVILGFGSGAVIANDTGVVDLCVDPKDTYNNYDSKVEPGDIKNLKSEYYILSYTWAPNHCAKASPESKRPGKRNYLQCNSGREFGYVLHGLWPQGSISAPRKYPRACEGDQRKIDREVLEKYLCMTPSFWLLQHEYEFHGTCMHDESLEEPDVYFGKAKELHSRINLPNCKLEHSSASVQWFVDHNPHFTHKSIQYYSGGQEWQFCYNNDFEVMDCPNRTGSEAQKDCKVKGNISGNSRKKYYFTTAHPNYQSVSINVSKGERCFKDEQEAISAGWVKAP